MERGETAKPETDTAWPPQSHVLTSCPYGFRRSVLGGPLAGLSSNGAGLEPDYRSRTNLNVKVLVQFGERPRTGQRPAGRWIPWRSASRYRIRTLASARNGTHLSSQPGHMSLQALLSLRWDPSRIADSRPKGLWQPILLVWRLGAFPFLVRGLAPHVAGWLPRHVHPGTESQESQHARLWTTMNHPTKHQRP